MIAHEQVRLDQPQRKIDMKYNDPAYQMSEVKGLNESAQQKNEQNRVWGSCAELGWISSILGSQF